MPRKKSRKPPEKIHPLIAELDIHRECKCPLPPNGPFRCLHVLHVRTDFAFELLVSRIRIYGGLTYQDRDPCTTPTDAMPQTPGKVQEMSRREDLDQSLWHPDDALPQQADHLGREIDVGRNGAVHRRQLSFIKALNARALKPIDDEPVILRFSTEERKRPA